MTDSTYNITDGTYGPRIEILGHWSDSILKAFRNHGIRELDLNRAKGWRGSDIHFVTKLKNIELIDIIDWQIKDLSAIHDLKQLKSIKLNTNCKQAIDYSQFLQLEKLSLEWNDSAHSAMSCKSLKSIFLNCCPYKDLRPFAELSSLQSLRLASPKLENLGGIKSLMQIRELGIYYAGNLCTLSGIEFLKDLEKLEVERCRKISEIQAVSELECLKVLSINNNRDIESLKPIENHNCLEEVYFYESTKIVDGDMSPLFTLPRLRRVSYQNREHYTHTREIVKEWISKNRRGA